jgi:hypothetical protein
MFGWFTGDAHFLDRQLQTNWQALTGKSRMVVFRGGVSSEEQHKKGHPHD